MKDIKLSYNQISHTTLVPAEDTRYLIDCFHGNSLGHVSPKEDQKSLTVKLQVPGISCVIKCVCKLGDNQVFNLSTSVIHSAPSTRSHTLVKVVLDDGGESRYIGRVVVEKGAFGSDARLEERSLVIGDRTLNHAEPIMQIETDDVTASHASTTGRLDEQQVFYLMSRGLSMTEAKSILVKAFLELPLD